MKRAWLSLTITAVGITAFAACGGSTSEFVGDNADAGASSAGSAGAGGSSPMPDGGNAGSANTTDASAPFDPGSIGAFINAGVEAGVYDGATPPAREGGAAPPAVIPPAVVDGCNALCAKANTAACPNQGTVQDCVLGCRLFLNNNVCAAASDSLFACSKTSPVSCDAQGKASFTSCPVESLSAAVCFLQNANDPTLKPTCTEYCANVASAKCPNDDIAGCPGGCRVVGNFIPTCNDAWKAYVECAKGSMMTCGADGKAGAPACGLQFLGYALCLYGGALNVGDAGR